MTCKHCKTLKQEARKLLKKHPIMKLVKVEPTVSNADSYAIYNHQLEVHLWNIELWKADVMDIINGKKKTK